MGWVFGLCWLCFGMFFLDLFSGSGFLCFCLLVLVWSVGDFFWFGIFLGLGGSCKGRGRCNWFSCFVFGFFIFLWFFWDFVGLRVFWLRILCFIVLISWFGCLGFKFCWCCFCLGFCLCYLSFLVIWLVWIVFLDGCWCYVLFCCSVVD